MIQKNTRAETTKNTLIVAMNKETITLYIRDVLTI